MQNYSKVEHVDFAKKAYGSKFTLIQLMASKRSASRCLFLQLTLMAHNCLTSSHTLERSSSQRMELPGPAQD